MPRWPHTSARCLSVYLAENEPYGRLILLPNLPLSKLAHLGEWAWVGRVDNLGW